MFWLDRLEEEDLGAPELRGLRGLRVPCPEAMLLYAAMHCSKHGWIHGLKLAYDVTWICQQFPDLNWNWLARLVARTGMKREFWTPLVVLAGELELPLPAHFLRRAPQDRRQQKLQSIARRHLFGAEEPWFNENSWAFNALCLLQSGSWLHRARHAHDLVFGPNSVQLRRLSARRDPGHRRARWAKLGHALRALRGW